MASTLAAFRTRFPEFASIDDDRVDMFLDDARVVVDETKWGKFYDYGVLYFAAHLLAVDNAQQAAQGAGGGVGPTSSRTVGPLNYKRAVNPLNAAKDDALLASTSYGVQYLEYRRLILPVGFMVVSNASFTESQFSS